MGKSLTYLRACLCVAHRQTTHRQIREVFDEISRPRDPPLTPPKRGIVESPPEREIICAIIKYVDLS